MLCVGGAREALLAEEDQFQIVLGKRMVLVPHYRMSCPSHYWAVLSVEVFNMSMAHSMVLSGSLCRTAATLSVM